MEPFFQFAHVMIYVLYVCISVYSERSSHYRTDYMKIISLLSFRSCYQTGENEGLHWTLL